MEENTRSLALSPKNSNSNRGDKKSTKALIQQIGAKIRIKNK